jgi:hypothetical protein
MYQNKKKSGDLRHNFTVIFQSIHLQVLLLEEHVHLAYFPLFRNQHGKIRIFSGIVSYEIQGTVCFDLEGTWQLE